MTVEYILILVFTVSLGLKVLISVPAKAFSESAPKLASRIEKQLVTGDGFNENARAKWNTAASRPQ